MRIVCFLDLDDTIFQTRAKCPAGEEVRPVAYHRDGTPLSYMTQRQRTLLDMLFRSGTVIPTTARSFDAYRRVDLPFSQSVILDFGGVVLLPGGTLDQDWDARIRPSVLELGSELHSLQRRIEHFIAERRLGAYSRVISDFDMPLYLVVKHPQGDSAKLQPIRDELQSAIGEGRFFLHWNDNNLSCVPGFLGKEHAVKHVMQHHLGGQPLLTVGMGDSLTDALFLEHCDYSLIPRVCQLSGRRRTHTQDS